MRIADSFLEGQVRSWTKEMVVSEVVATPDLPPIETAEDQIGGTGANRSLKPGGLVASMKVKTTGGLAGQNHIHLYHLVALG
jgi:hypothetical protein